MKESDFYFTRYCIPEQKQITFYQFFNERDRLRFYHALGRGMYAKNLRKEGMIFKDIATYLGVSPARALQIVRKYERYERKNGLVTGKLEMFMQNLNIIMMRL